MWYTDIMKYDKIHPAVREALGIYEGFRKLGFPSDYIFAGLKPLDPKTGVVCIVLKAQGKEFTVDAGLMRATQEEFAEIWGKTATAVVNREVSPVDLSRIYEESLPYQRSAEFMAALLLKGIETPKRRGRDASI